MAKTFRRVTKAHRAALSAAAKKRWAKKPTRSEFARKITDAIVDYDPTFAQGGAAIGSTLRLNVNRTNGLISRMTQAIDKIQSQIERLESF